MRNCYSPLTLEESLKILKEIPCWILAGGTDFMLKKERDISENILYLGKISELKYIEEEGARIKIGAMTTLDNLEKSQILENFLPLLDTISSPGIKNHATIGGNLCNASPIGDMIPPMYALNGKVVLARQEGKREIPVEEFFLGRKKTALEREEVLTEINFENLKEYKFIWKKVAGREANALSKLSLFVAYKEEKGKLSDLRVAIGGMGPEVIRDRELEEEILKKLSLREKPGIEGYMKIISPITDGRSDAAYKTAVFRNILTGALSEIKNEIGEK
ncbi:MAG: FAD binding domain-containing protein [Fusobacteriaceae bacterium]